MQPSQIGWLDAILLIKFGQDGNLFYSSNESQSEVVENSIEIREDGRVCLCLHVEDQEYYGLISYCWITNFNRGSY